MVPEHWWTQAWGSAHSPASTSGAAVLAPTHCPPRAPEAAGGGLCTQHPDPSGQRPQSARPRRLGEV